MFLNTVVILNKNFEDYVLRTIGVFPLALLAGPRHAAPCRANLNFHYKFTAPTVLCHAHFGPSPEQGQTAPGPLSNVPNGVKDFSYVIFSVIIQRLP